MSDPTYQMLWRCEQCQTAGLLALTQRYCPQCGTAQDAAKRYFPKEGEEVAVENHRFTGADWPCEYCEAPNSAASAFCTHCGGPREGRKTVALIKDGQGPQTDNAAESAVSTRSAVSLAQTAAVPAGAIAQNTSRSGSVPKAALALGIAVIALVAYLLVSGVSGLTSLFAKHDEVAHIVDQQWSRSVNVEHFAATSGSEWCDSMPPDAYNVSRSREQRGTREVEDGQTCQTVREDKGDGTFTKRRECEPRYRSEPVYDNRCRFQVNRWSVLRTEALQGDSLVPPVWPTPQLAGTPLLAGGPALGSQRLGTQVENYTVKLRTAEGKEETCRLPESRWTALKSGQTVSIKVRLITGVDCDSVLPVP